jgi:hypothetical protein
MKVGLIPAAPAACGSDDVRVGAVFGGKVREGFGDWVRDAVPGGFLGGQGGKPAE